MARAVLNNDCSPKSKPKPDMKKPIKAAPRPGLTFGDLVVALSSVSRNSNETAAALTDLLESGKVRLTNNGRTIRARVA